MMTTYRQLATHFLTSRGLTDDQVSPIMDEVLAHPSNRILLGYWDDDNERFRPSVRSVMMEIVRSTALAWLDTHVPQSSLRFAFVTTDGEPIPYNTAPFPMLDPVEPR